MYFSRRIIIILLSILLLVILATIINKIMFYDGKKFYKTYTGDIVTIWDNYIIFEKYEGKEPPKDNYLKMIGPYKGEVCMFFKANDSLIIWRSFDENSMEIALSQQDYKIEVFYAGSYTYEDYKEFRRKTGFKDTLIYKEYQFYSFPEDGNILFPIFRECIGDSVYIRSYKASTRFYKDNVCSRYDAKLNR